MRYLLTVLIVLLFNYNAFAQFRNLGVDETEQVFLFPDSGTDSLNNQDNEVMLIESSLFDGPILNFGKKAELATSTDIQSAILYKMRENIIRRALSFTPRKKWLKWV